jgi:energy-coupling factor transporter ATP-binding protein EcfA2
MSGRENIYVNGMLLGLSRTEVTERFNDIIAFAEMAEFVDTPVKFYSSGMFMRLGFAVAVNVEPQVLLVDEVLAVGDVAFQYKCLERMRALQAAGTTIVLVSHSMHAIRLLCPRAILMRRGRLEYDGDTEGAVARHFELLASDSTNDHSGPASEGSVSVVERALIGPHGPTHHPDQDDLLLFRCKLAFNQAVDSPAVWFQVLNEGSLLAYSMHTEITRHWGSFQAGDTAVVEVMFRPRLAGGTYRLGLVITDREGRNVLGSDPQGLMAYLAPRLGSEGIADLDATIRLNGQELSDHETLLMATQAPPETDAGRAVGR